jgi:hypothetical protein
MLRLISKTVIRMCLKPPQPWGFFREGMGRPIAVMSNCRSSHASFFEAGFCIPVMDEAEFEKMAGVERGSALRGSEVPGVSLLLFRSRRTMPRVIEK